MYRTTSNVNNSDIRVLLFKDASSITEPSPNNLLPDEFNFNEFNLSASNAIRTLDILKWKRWKKEKKRESRD